MASVVLGALVLAGSVACGDEQSPGEAAPVLATRLDRVDAAIAAGEYDRARAALGALGAATAQARVAGKITDEQAGRILDAISAVLAELPAKSNDPGSSPEAPPEEEVTLPPGEDSGGGGDEGDEGNSDSGENEDKGKDKGKGKDKKEGGGNGPSSDNGPDDGHGN